MTLNLTELRDDPLGKHPSQAAVCTAPVLCYVNLDAQQDVVAADDESSFTFDVEGLGDEPLDDSPSVSAEAVCGPCLCTCYADGLGDEALDDSPSVSAFGYVCNPFCYVDGLADEALDDSPSVSAMYCVVSCRCDGLSDEALDPRPAVNAAGCAVCIGF
ncbi:MAG: hypothetical protein HON79_03730 [Acidiferrobacteraceae bacterium]|jgi:hypothetical protein|nr:hypothetical protein [Acidiferrobacteraceae bacterium]